MVPIDSVIPHPANPNRGDVAAIAQSLTVNTQYRPIVVQDSTGHIIAGNHTWLAAQSLGWPDIAAIRVDVDDDTAARILAVDNRAAQLAHYDDAALLELLRQIAATEAGLDGSGWANEDLNALLDLNSPPLTAEELAGKHTGDPDDPTFNPRIELTVAVTVMDAWRCALDQHPGDDDAEKLAGLLTEVLHCRGGNWTPPP
jgi:hypothetical protein